MVSQREGHTSGVCDLFFQTPLSNCRVQLVIQSSLFLKDCFQKRSLSLMQIGVTLSRGISLTFFLRCLSLFKEKNEMNNFANREHSWKGKTFLTGLKQQWSLPELQFRAPTKTRALNPQSWQGEGGPWMKGRAGIMVNHRVKHAT